MTRLASFRVRFHDGKKWKKRTMIIHEEHIQCQKIPNIQFDSLTHIVLNNSAKKIQKHRSFGLRCKGIVYNFLAKDREQRNQILLMEILARYPTNETNRTHWKIIKSATKEVVLEIEKGTDTESSDIEKGLDAESSDIEKGWIIESTTESSTLSTDSVSNINTKLFNVQIRDSDKGTWIETTITIHEKHIHCPEIPDILFDELTLIVINDAEKEEHRERSFGIQTGGHLFDFLAMNREQRNQILLMEILQRLPPNKTNRAHRETIQSATNRMVLTINHKATLSDLPNVQYCSGGKCKSIQLPTDKVGVEIDRKQKVRKWQINDVGFEDERCHEPNQRVFTEKLHGVTETNKPVHRTNERDFGDTEIRGSVARAMEGTLALDHVQMMNAQENKVVRKTLSSSSSSSASEKMNHKTTKRMSRNPKNKDLRSEDNVDIHRAVSAIKCHCGSKRVVIGKCSGCNQQTSGCLKCGRRLLQCDCADSDEITLSERNIKQDIEIKMLDVRISEEKRRAEETRNQNEMKERERMERFFYLLIQREKEEEEKRKRQREEREQMECDRKVLEEERLRIETEKARIAEQQRIHSDKTKHGVPTCSPPDSGTKRIPSEQPSPMRKQQDNVWPPPYGCCNIEHPTTRESTEYGRQTDMVPISVQKAPQICQQSKAQDQVSFSEVIDFQCPTSCNMYNTDASHFDVRVQSMQQHVDCLMNKIGKLTLDFPGPHPKSFYKEQVPMSFSEQIHEDRTSWNEQRDNADLYRIRAVDQLSAPSSLPLKSTATHSTPAYCLSSAVRSYRSDEMKYNEGIASKKVLPFCSKQTEESVRSTNVDFKEVFKRLAVLKRLAARKSMDAQENKIARETTRIRTDFRQMIQDASEKMNDKREMHVRDNVHTLPSQFKRGIRERHCACSPKPVNDEERTEVRESLTDEEAIILRKTMNARTTEFRQLIQGASKKMNNKRNTNARGTVRVLPSEFKCKISDDSTDMGAEEQVTVKESLNPQNSQEKMISDQNKKIESLQEQMNRNYALIQRNKKLQDTISEREMNNELNSKQQNEKIVNLIPPQIDGKYGEEFNQILSSNNELTDDGNVDNNPKTSKTVKVQEVQHQEPRSLHRQHPRIPSQLKRRMHENCPSSSKPVQSAIDFSESELHDAPSRTSNRLGRSTLKSTKKRESRNQEFACKIHDNWKNLNDDERLEVREILKEEEEMILRESVRDSRSFSSADRSISSYASDTPTFTRELSTIEEGHYEKSNAPRRSTRHLYQDRETRQSLSQSLSDYSESELNGEPPRISNQSRMLNEDLPRKSTKRHSRNQENKSLKSENDDDIQRAMSAIKCQCGSERVIVGRCTGCNQQTSGCLKCGRRLLQCDCAESADSEKIDDSVTSVKNLETPPNFEHEAIKVPSNVYTVVSDQNEKIESLQGALEYVSGEGVIEEFADQSQGAILSAASDEMGALDHPRLERQHRVLYPADRRRRKIQIDGMTMREIRRQYLRKYQRGKLPNERNAMTRERRGQIQWRYFVATRNRRESRDRNLVAKNEGEEYDMNELLRMTKQMAEYENRSHQ